MKKTMTIIEIINDPAYISILEDVCLKKEYKWTKTPSGRLVSFVVYGKITPDDLKTTYWVASLRYSPYFNETLINPDIDDSVVVDSDLLRSISDIDIQVDTMSRTVSGLLD